jgi:hypothetical protein
MNKALVEVMDSADFLYIRWPKDYRHLLEIHFGYRGKGFLLAAGYSAAELDRLRHCIAEAVYAAELPPYYQLVINAFVTDTYYHHLGVRTE